MSHAGAPADCVPTPSELTGRERQVLLLVSAGMTTARIAEALGICACTVESHVAAAMSRLGAHTRQQAAVIVARATVEPTGGYSCPLPSEQRQLLRLLADGKSLAQAAPLMHVSLRTANRRLARAKEALGVQTTAEAVMQVAG